MPGERTICAPEYRGFNEKGLGPGLLSRVMVLSRQALTIVMLNVLTLFEVYTLAVG